MRRRVFAAAALVAGAVAAVFLLLGDGVSAPHLSGPLVLLPRWGHAIVWLLLAAAFAVAAVRGRWRRTSGVLALLGALVYLLLVVALLGS